MHDPIYRGRYEDRHLDNSSARSMRFGFQRRILPVVSIQALRDGALRIRSMGWAIDDVEFPSRRLQEKIDQEGFVIIKIRDI